MYAYITIISIIVTIIINIIIIIITRGGSMIRIWEGGGGVAKYYVRA